MNNFFLVPFVFLIFISGCTSVENIMNNNATSGMIDELNKTLSNISEQISDDLSKGLNDSINQFVSGILNITFDAFEKSPVSNFNDEEIIFLGVNCGGSEQDIAECIKDWQVSNMTYDASQPDSSYSIRWNYAFPGLYPSSEIIKEKVKDGKIYGTCFDFAIIYCSIANYYNLTCRVVNSITKPSDNNPSLLDMATGLGPEEYDDLIIKLNSKGLNYTYELVRQIMKETPEHYWAEVNLNGEWVVFDATNVLVEGSDTKTNYIDINDYETSVWENNETLNIINNYYSKADDLGQKDRAWTIDDYFGSKASGQVIPVPYYDSCSSVCAFFLGKNPTCSISCIMDSSFFACYESCSSHKFYKICDYICEDEGYEQCYNDCSGEELNIDCFNEC
ncbi:MAG: transglutaminase domain-containing protein [Candidatus Nanoarchaeia archaeon]|jgi:hypothetical protein